MKLLFDKNLLSRRALLLAAVLALVTLAYLPGLRGPFVFDDYPNIVNNPTVAVTALTPASLHAAATSNTSGPLGRPLAALSFALDHWRAGGFDPLAFKLSNLAIHLLNVLLVYALAGRLARLAGAGAASGAVALFAALLWGLHPLQLTSVLYVVQRMTSLAATFTLAAMLCWLQTRERWQRPAEPIPDTAGAASAANERAGALEVAAEAAPTTRGVASGIDAAGGAGARERWQRPAEPTPDIAGAASAANKRAGAPEFAAEAAPTGGLGLGVDVLAGPAPRVDPGGRDRRITAGWLLACGVFFVLGLLSKETAVLLPLYLAVIEFTLWRRADRPDGGRRAANRFFALTLALPLVVGVLLFAWQPGLLLDGYAGRPFTLGERLLTEARVRWIYVGLVLLPTPPRLGLYHDDIELSTWLLDPWTTLVALDGLALALGAALLLRRRAPALSLGVLWFLAGHALESTVVPLEIAHEHRNYLPSFGLLFAAVYGVAAFARRTGRAPLYGALGAAAALALGFGTFGRAAEWHREETIIEALYRHHPRSASAQQMMGELMLKRFGQPAQAAVHYRRAHALAPWEAGYLIRALWAQRAAGEPLPLADESLAVATALRQRPVPPTTLIALQSLSDCVRAAHSDCRGMQGTLLAWLAAAHANLHLDPVAREQVRLSYGQVCLETARYAQGLVWVRAVYAQSGQAVYRLMEANFLMLQGDLDAAARLLTQIARMPRLTATDREHIDVLHEAIATRRTASPSPRKGQG